MKYKNPTIRSIRREAEQNYILGTLAKRARIARHVAVVHDRKVKRDEVRRSIAQKLGVNPRRVILTGGGARTGGKIEKVYHVTA